MTDAVREVDARRAKLKDEFYNDARGIALYARDGLMEEWHDADVEYHLLIVSEAAATLENPISRKQLVIELDEAINSVLNYGEEIVRHMEYAQVFGGQWTRYDIRAMDAAGRRRVMPQSAYERAQKVLEKHCPRRQDNQRWSTPYPLKKSEGSGFVAA